jgi:NADPH:quinone reductase-like Zn-dependent oxidoreductase
MAPAPPPSPGLKQRLAARWPIGELTGWAGASGFGARSTAAQVLEAEDLRGRVYIVTGGSAGLGRATAAALSSAGAHVVLAVRNAARGDIAAAELGVEALRAGRGGSVVSLYCDLASFASVRAFACAFVSSCKALNGLICNGAHHSSSMPCYCV